MILLIVFIHQLLCIENTKEQLPVMNFCHPLQENISSFRGLLPRRPPAYRFFFSGYATDSHAVFSPEKDVMRNLCRVLTSSVLCDTSFRPVASENKELAYQKSNVFFFAGLRQKLGIFVDDITYIICSCSF